jgi:hypothetical protein
MWPTFAGAESLVAKGTVALLVIYMVSLLAAWTDGPEKVVRMLMQCFRRLHQVSVRLRHYRLSLCDEHGGFWGGG